MYVIQVFLSLKIYISEKIWAIDNRKNRQPVIVDYNSLELSDALVNAQPDLIETILLGERETM